MSRIRAANADELKKLFDAMLELLSWQQRLVYEALDTLKKASGKRGTKPKG